MRLRSWSGLAAPSLPTQSLAADDSLLLVSAPGQGFSQVTYQDARDGTSEMAARQQIEIPKFVTLSDDYALARPRANALEVRLEARSRPQY